MHRINPILILVFSLLFAPTCIVEDADIEPSFIGQEPVLFAFLHPDSVIQVQLFYTKSPLEDTHHYIEAATVALFEDDVQIEELPYLGKNGVYRSILSTRPKVGHNYRMEIVAISLPGVISTPNESIPPEIVIDSLTLQDSMVFQGDFFGLPKLSVYVDKANRATVDFFLFALANLFDYIATIDARNLLVIDYQDCLPNLLSFEFGGLIGKNFGCVDTEEPIEFGIRLSNNVPVPGDYRFTFGTMNPSAASFFESMGAPSGFDETELFFQPSVVKGNVPGVHGVFTAFNTTDFNLTF